MQINGLTSHTTQIASSSRTHHTTIEMPKQNTLQDSVSITELGKRISMRGTEKAGSLMRSSGSQVQGVAELMSKSLAKIESTLERMKELTQKASNTDLTELDRMTMQIEFEELRETLSGASLKMNEGLAQITGKKLDKPKLTAPVAAPDGTKILERARDRLLRGEKWDVAEAYQHVFDEETGEEVTGRWMIGDLQYIIDGTKLDTVRDKIEASDTVNLMSIKTAREGIERVDTQLMRVCQVNCVRYIYATRISLSANFT